MNAMAHIVPKKTYYVVFVALLVLLVLTLGVSYIDLGVFNPIVALSIAVAKALLVMLYFMHLRWSGYLSWAVAGAGFIWLALLFLLTFSDYLTRGWLSNPY